MERSDNDKLYELSDKEKQEQQKNLTKESKLLNAIEMQLRSMDGAGFDFHLFLVLFNIFKESQTDIRLRQYAAQMPTDDMPRFKSTVFAFNEFLYKFVKLNLNTSRDDSIVYQSPHLLDKLAEAVNEYNIAQGEIIFRLPDLEEAKPSLFDAIRKKLIRGQERLLKRK